VAKNHIAPLIQISQKTDSGKRYSREKNGLGWEGTKRLLCGGRFQQTKEFNLESQKKTRVKEERTMRGVFSEKKERKKKHLGEKNGKSLESPSEDGLKSGLSQGTFLIKELGQGRLVPKMRAANGKWIKYTRGNIRMTEEEREAYTIIPSPSKECGAFGGGPEKGGLLKKEEGVEERHRKRAVDAKKSINPKSGRRLERCSTRA